MLTTRQKVSYGIARLGTTTLLNIVTLFTFWAYKSVFEIPAQLSGIGNASGKIAIALSGFIFGFISDAVDRSNSKWGKRKVFMWIGAPFLAFSFIMLFTPHLFIPVEYEMIRFGWLIIWNSLFHMFYGLLIIPYQSWMPEITKEDERINVSAIQNIANIVATLIGTGYTLLIADYFMGAGEMDSTTSLLLLLFAVLFGVFEVLLFLPALLTIKEKKAPYVKRNFKKEIRTALKNRNYVIYVISSSIMWVGVIMVSALVIDFFQIILGLDTQVMILVFAVVMFIAIVTGFIMWSYIGNRIGKKKSLIIGFIFAIVWIPLTPAIGRIPGIPIIAQGYIYGIGAIIGVSCAFLFGYAIISDLVDKDERDTSLNKSGMYTGFKNIPINIGQAAGYIIAGYLSVWKDNLGLTWLGPIAIIFLIVAFPIFIQGNYDPFLNNNLRK
jgi:GPH family glycoside/pentoside/hexuronide:cation symporter